MYMHNIFQISEAYLFLFLYTWVVLSSKVMLIIEQTQIKKKNGLEKIILYNQLRDQIIKMCIVTFIKT